MRRKAGGAQIWPRTTPEQLMGISNVTAISIGGGHILMLKNVKTRGPLVTQQQRDDFVNALTAGTMSRGQVVRAVAGNPIVGNREFNPAYLST